MNDQSTFRNAVKWAYVLTAAERGIAMLLTFVLAVVLGPNDFGIAAMALAYIIFIEMFVAQGMGAAIIQRKDLTREHLDSIFWLIVAGSLVLAAISIALSQWWATVNDLPGLAPVVIVLSLSIPIKGLTVVQHALLQRKMNFRSLALLSGGAAIVGGAVGVTMAFSGFGVWALVVQQLVGSALATAVMWKVSDWRPRLFFSWRRARELFGFSGGMFASQLGVYAARQSDVILMGIFFGPVAVGLYRLADRFMEAVLEIGTRSIQTVALPHFCSLQDDAPRLRAAVLSCIRLSATITIPAMTLLALASDEVMLLLGEKWAPASGVLKIVVFMGMAKVLTLFTGPALLAKGRSKTVAALIWTLGLVTAGGIAITGAAFHEALIDSQIAAVAFVRTGLFVGPYGLVMLVVTKWLCGIPLRQLGGAFFPGCCAALAAVATVSVIFAGGALQNIGSFLSLILIVAPAALAAGITVVALDQTVRNVVLLVIHRIWIRRRPATQNALPTRQS